MRDEELGKLAYEAAAQVTGCQQPWDEANKEKWITAAVAVCSYVLDEVESRFTGMLARKKLRAGGSDGYER